MYKIMLADDEGIVIDSLTYIIRQNFGDRCEIDSAKTGRSVIELAEPLWTSRCPESTESRR